MYTGQKTPRLWFLTAGYVQFTDRCPQLDFGRTVSSRNSIQSIQFIFGKTDLCCIYRHRKNAHGQTRKLSWHRPKWKVGSERMTSGSLSPASSIVIVSHLRFSPHKCKLLFLHSELYIRIVCMI